jgi:pimeloyl-ACP methyl ester carboxylesterase
VARELGSSARIEIGSIESDNRIARPIHSAGRCALGWPTARRSSYPGDSMAEILKIDGVQLDLHRWPGTGTPILLLHEALGAATTWRDFPERLAARTGHPVVAWSRQGFGQSDPRLAPPARDYLHRETERVPPLLDALGMERAHLYGHSDGAAIALITAAMFTQRVASLVLEAPHVSVEAQTTAAIVAVRDQYANGQLRAKLARHHRDPDGVFANWADTWLDSGFASWSIEDLLPRVTAPVLLIQGRDDPYFSLGQLDRIARVVPETRRLELADCRHAPYRERTNPVLETTADFLQSCESQ